MKLMCMISYAVCYECCLCGDLVVTTLKETESVHYTLLLGILKRKIYRGNKLLIKKL
jgi:hypothetical protein